MTQHDWRLDFFVFLSCDWTLIYNPNLSFTNASDKKKLSQEFEGAVALDGPKP